MINKKKLILFFVILFGLPILIAVIGLIIDVMGKPTIDEVNIANLEQYIDSENSNPNMVSAIKSRLYDTIGYNTDGDIDIKNLKAYVREGSFTQTYDADTGLNKVSFIVDIPEVQQSYLAKYEWDSLEADSVFSNRDEWGTNIFCLDKELLIYGDFGCKDINDYVYTVDDPVARILPHIENSRWGVYYIDDYEGGIYKLQLDIYACVDVQADPLEDEAWEWMRDNIPNLDSYRVDVSYCK